MSVPWAAVDYWPVRIALIGGAVLLAGRLVLALTRQPARRALFGTAAVVAALLVIPLSLLPSWLPVTVATAAPETAAIPGPSATVSTEPPGETAKIGPSNRGLVFLSPTDSDNRPAPLPANDLPAPSPERNAAATSPSPSFTWWTIALAVYGTIAGLLLVRLAVGQIVLARVWRSSRPAPDWAERLFGQLAEPLCPRAGLRVSARPAGPVCFGVFRPRVVVPATLLATGDEPALRAVLSHELGHLSRRDPLTGWLLGLARAVYFVWPWLAGLRREVRLAQEYLADADAARASAPADYAELLIRMTRARPAPLGAAGVRGPSSELYRRVTMLLRSSGRVEKRCPRRWAVAVGGGLTALAVAAAGIYVQPRSAVAAEPKPVAKDADKPDPLKEAIDSLKKNLEGNPELVKQLDELIKAIREGRPAQPTVGGLPKRTPRAVAPIARPGQIEQPDLDKEIDQAQELIRRYLEAMTARMQAGGFQEPGVFIGPPGAMRPFGRVSGGRLGVRVEKPSDVLASQLELPNGQGLVCVDVPADSPAGKAGIKPNDILLEVAGKPVPNNRDEFVKGLKEVKPDTPVDIVVMRKGKKETLKGVKLPEAKEIPDIAFPGLDFQGPGILAPPPVFPRPASDLPEVGRNSKVVVGPGETARVEQVNDAFTVFYTKNGIKVTISGSKDADGVPKAESIEVEADGKTTKAESIDKLPKEYQDLARSAMKAIK
jgi:beta-lactamase regulating signal transducer with metallopeptidase domain